MAGGIRQLSARGVFLGLVAAGFLVMLGANLPGHLSYDSVAQLSEGHFHVRETWGPALYAWLLGVFDGIVPGTALYVVASGLLFFGSLASLADRSHRVSWLAAPVTALILLTPQVMIYQAIVWKDVIFANCAIAGLVCLAHAAGNWARGWRRWLYLAGALVLLAAGADVRQNGLIAALAACVALGWIASRGSWRRGIVWAVAGFAAVLITAQSLTVMAMPKNAPKDTAGSTGVRIVQNYDLVGAVALDPTYRLPILAAVDPVNTKTLLDRAKSDYSGRRVDFMDRDATIGAALNLLPGPETQAQWFDLIFKHPALYLRVRWEDFRWVFMAPVPDWCLPVYVGVDAPLEKLGPLKMEHRFVLADAQLNNYASWFLDTPAYWHATYAAISLVLAGLFLWRRRPQDIALAALQLAGVGFSASFFIISIACDYRYLYFTDLAAMTGLVYAAVAPAFFRRRAKA